uniref:Putative ixostatin n=1 Tax=Ixodes ricinus TaxID=34613 RepID=A0A0K8RDD2_IXORI
MIRMMIFPLSFVLLAASGYLHASQLVPLNPDPDTCSAGLREHMMTRCSNLNATLVSFSVCSFTCKGKNRQDQDTTTAPNLMDGLPCGLCRECCNGRCTPVKFNFHNPLSLESCAKQKGSS